MLENREKGRSHVHCVDWTRLVIDVQRMGYSTRDGLTRPRQPFSLTELVLFYSNDIVVQVWTPIFCA